MSSPETPNQPEQPNPSGHNLASREEVVATLNSGIDTMRKAPLEPLHGDIASNGIGAVLALAEQLDQAVADMIASADPIKAGAREATEKTEAGHSLLNTAIGKSEQVPAVMAIWNAEAARETSTDLVVEYAGGLEEILKGIRTSIGQILVDAGEYTAVQQQALQVTEQGINFRNASVSSAEEYRDGPLS